MVHDGAADEPARVRSTLGIGPQDTLALFLGPIELRKGIDLLLEAFARLARRWPRLHLVLAGPRLDITHPGGEAFDVRVSGLVEASGAADRVHFTGMVQDPETYMRAADLFVFPSLKEGFGMVIIEAMACGTPVLTTRVSAIPEVVGDAGVLVEPSDPRGLADGIFRFMEDAELGKRLFAAGLKRVRERFSWRVVVEKTLEALQGVVRDGIAGGAVH